jgi:hypothetical protein
MPKSYKDIKLRIENTLIAMVREVIQIFIMLRVNLVCLIAGY